VNIFVFDIETVPDTKGGQKILELEGLTNNEIAEAMFLKAREERGSEFIRLHLQKIVAISVVFRHRESLKVWSLGDESSSEKELIERFFGGIAKFMPNLVSWNGSGFDLPVLHYRALINNVVAPVYWETGDFDSNFKWNNYLNRYHYRHLDLMDVMAGYQREILFFMDFTIDDNT